MKVEEWNALSPEEQVTRKEEMPEELKKPDDRSYQNIAAEERRKREALEKKLADIEARLEEREEYQTPNSYQNPTSTNPTDQYSRIAAMAEDEMARTGRAVPAETIVRMINQGTMHVVGQINQSQTKAKSVRRKAKQDLRSKYKDFGRYEDEFDDYVDSLNPSSVTKEGLEIIYNSVRGKHSDELEKEIEERLKKKYETGNLEIVGPDAGSGKGKPPSSTKLNPQQQKEMMEMSIDSEETYINLLKRKQERAKAIGSSVSPQLLSDSIHKKV